ncbi:SDR family oxidoreductase [Microvirga massiliensis]|uniref:SDR family oxidoreductase n=1 Tax=Microvirga massiliensis TaxID=1033741 RepID=UPI00065FA99E|nr:SDR family oxidoreductase [Microvirga massiliensis]
MNLTSVPRSEDDVDDPAQWPGRSGDGAAGTLGRAIAEKVERAGGTVFRTDLRGNIGRNIDQSHDVTREEDWRNVIAALGQRFGRLDGLVNNAGILHIGSVEDTSLADWHRVMSVNADSVFLGCHCAWELLGRSQTASIVNISSVSRIVGGANLTAYNASNGAVRLLTKSVALHSARQTPPDRCNSVHPSFVEGAMAEAALAAATNPERALTGMVRDIPMGRLARPGSDRVSQHSGGEDAKEVAPPHSMIRLASSQSRRLGEWQRRRQ